MLNRLLVFNLMTDADDPVLGFTTDWLNALAARCGVVDVITMQAGRLAVAGNVRVYSVGKEKGYSEPHRALEFYRILLGLLRRHRYDACFAHMIHRFAVLGAPLLKIWRVPITLWYTHKAVSLSLRMADKLVDHVVTASVESFRLPSHKVQVIGHGIDTRLFCVVSGQRSAVSSRRFEIISVGRIGPVKRLETIIAAVHRLVYEQGMSQARLRIVGKVYPQDMAYAERLRQMVTDNQLESVIEFVGSVPHEQTVHEYQNADVMVNMSATGSIDKAVLEAMACGLPVVTANEAFQNILAPWGDLLLVPPESPDLLAMRLARIAAMSPDEHTALGVELRKIVVEHHSLENLVEQLMRIFTV
jgi:glycosyltransferase involved in cell wall biosynthesis